MRNEDTQPFQSGRREGTRLVIDDPDYCKKCGADISALREFFEAELCGSCLESKWKHSVRCPDCDFGRVMVADAVYAECDNCDATLLRKEVGL